MSHCLGDLLTRRIIVILFYLCVRIAVCHMVDVLESLSTEKRGKLPVTVHSFCCTMALPAEAMKRAEKADRPSLLPIE